MKIKSKNERTSQKLLKLENILETYAPHVILDRAKKSAPDIKHMTLGGSED